MRIGILIKEFNQLRNFELRIIDEIRRNPSLELALLIKDGRPRKTSKYKLLRLLKSENILGNLLFKVQITIENKLFKPKSFPNKAEIIAYLNTIPTLSLSPNRKGFLDIFSQEDADKVNAYHLDILLRQGFSIIRGGILNSAKHGIWSFHHGDNDINRGGPPGLWEIILKNPVIGVTLQQLTHKLDGGLVIDKGYYKMHWSCIKNYQNVMDQSVSILLKNIRKLERNELTLKKSNVYYNPLYKVPKAPIMLNYMIKFYYSLFKKAYQSMLTKLFHVRFQCWTLFIGKGNFLDTYLYQLQPIELPKNEFWADPFLFTFKNIEYVFFENYSYKKKKGKISCGKIDNNKIIEVVDVLECDYHLSYPFIFEEDNELFMIPETLQNKRVEIFKCVDFPTKWELFSTAFENEPIVDTNYYKDDLNQRWLFLNKGYGNDRCSELYIYKIDSLKMNTIQEHKQNPVIIDARIARNAGSIYTYNNKLIRPSQNNSNGIYGYGLNINEIKKLTLDEYSEECLITVEPNFKKNLISTHHLCQSQHTFVIDGAFKRK